MMSRTQAPNQNEAIEFLPDNPCWGSPTQCDLKHLLTLISKKDVIVYETPHYVVLDKPPDLRMDGRFRSTVHKLLTYWYPPPSLRQICQDNNNSQDNQTYSDIDSDRLLKEAAKHHKSNSIPDNELRPCHQLDYATSGLLCMARSYEAASFAIGQWEDRNVQKEYLAVVHGNLQSLLTDAQPPRLEQSKIQESLKQLETNYRQSRRRPRKETFQGFQPAHSLFQKFKSTLSTDSNDNANMKPKKRKRGSLLTEEHWKDIWEPVRAIYQDDPANKKVLLSMDWKQISKTKKEWKRLFQKSAERHNDMLRDLLQGNSLQKDVELPYVFGQLPSNDTTNDVSDPAKRVLYISCPIAEDPDSFAMKIPPNLSKDGFTYPPNIESFVGSPTLAYKPSLTKCTIISEGYYDGLPVTKVQLLPLTGRRHQLRVHMAFLGHAILGDMTYSQETGNDRPKSEAPTDEVADVSTAVPSRMCLHSYKLALELLSPNTTLNAKSAGDEEDDKVNAATVKLETKDPFVFDANGRLDPKTI